MFGLNQHGIQIRIGETNAELDFFHIGEMNIAPEFCAGLGLDKIHAVGSRHSLGGAQELFV